MAQVTNPNVIQGMDPAQLWQLQQQLSLQQKQLYQNMVANTVAQQQLALQRKTDEWNSYSSFADNLVKANNGDLIQAMGVNPGFFKYGLMKFSGMNADQAEIAVENIRSHGVQNPDTWAKISWMQVVKDPFAAAQVVKPPAEAPVNTVKTSARTTVTTTPPKTEVPSSPPQPKVDQSAPPPTQQATSPLRSYLVEAAAKNQEYMAQTSNTERGMSTYASDRAPYTGDPQYKKDWAGERSANFAQMAYANTYLKDYVESWSKKVTGGGEAALKTLEAYINSTGTDAELKQIYGNLSPEEISNIRKIASIEWGKVSGGAIAKDIMNRFSGESTTIQPIRDQNRLRTIEGRGPVSQAGPGTALAQTNFISDAGNPAQAAAFRAAPQLGEYTGPATEVPDASTVAPQAETPLVSQETASEPVKVLASAYGTGQPTPEALASLQRGLIAARSNPAVRAFESAASKDPEKAKASPLAPKLAETVNLIGSKIKAQMDLAAKALAENKWDSSSRQAWRDTQLYVEQMKAEDFLGQYKTTMDKIDQIYRNPKGAEASYQDFTAHALAGGEGFLSKKNLDTAVDQLVAQINQWSAENALAARQIDVDEWYKKASIMASVYNQGQEAVPPGMSPDLWKMVVQRSNEMIDGAKDKNGVYSDNNFVKSLQVGNNRQVWDIYNYGMYLLFGGKGAFTSKAYKAWSGPGAGVFNVIRGILAKINPSGRAATEQYLSTTAAGRYTIFEPSLTGKEETPAMTSGDQAAFEQAMKDLAAQWGLGD